MNKAPLGGLHTPAVRRVRQTYCHHLYNYETIAFALVSRDTLKLELKPNKVTAVQVWLVKPCYCKYCCCV